MAVFHCWRHLVLLLAHFSPFLLAHFSLLASVGASWRQLAHVGASWRLLVSPQKHRMQIVLKEKRHCIWLTFGTKSFRNNIKTIITE